jgi:DNA-binding GntR family transcriptional regulator
MPNRKSVPDYMMLADNLEGQILGGQAPVGSMLPTETQLCEQYGMSRITVRAALRRLQDKGLVTRRAGVGTRVQATTRAAQFVHTGDSVDAVLQFTQGLAFQLLSVAEVTVDAGLEEQMSLPRGQLFLCAVGLRRAPGQPPLVLSRHYIPALYSGVRPRLDDHSGSIAELVAGHAGMDIHVIDQSIDTCRLAARDARTLEARPGTSALRTRRRYFGADDQLVVASESLFPEGRYRLTSTLRRERSTT